MSRFQAMTTALLDRELDELRQEMGLNASQKAELLRELTSIASWVVVQTRAGRQIEARGEDGVEVFRHPALTPGTIFQRLVLERDEASRLLTLLAEERPPSAALRGTLQRLADPEQVPPTLSWSSR